MIPLARIFFRFLLRLLFRAELIGYEKPVGKTLIVSNHQSFIDGLLIGAFLPFAPTYLVHTTIAAKWHFKILLSFIDHLVIDSTSPLAMKTVIALLESGAPVVIFPEGRITVTGSRMKIYDGPAFAAAKSGAMVLPLHIDGGIYSHFSRMPADFPQRWFPKVDADHAQAFATSHAGRAAGARSTSPGQRGASPHHADRRIRFATRDHDSRGASGSGEAVRQGASVH